MGRTSILASSLAELQKRIDSCDTHKKQLIAYSQRLYKKYVEGEYSYSRYTQLINEKINGKTSQEWLEYYEDYVENCNKLIDEKRSKIRIRKASMILLYSFISIFLVSSIFYIRPTIQGFTVEEVEEGIEEVGPSQDAPSTSEQAAERSIPDPEPIIEDPQLPSEENTTEEEIVQEVGPSQNDSLPPTSENITQPDPIINDSELPLPSEENTTEEEIVQEVGPSQNDSLPPTSENTTQPLPSEENTTDTEAPQEVGPSQGEPQASETIQIPSVESNISSIATLQYNAVIGQPVKWKKTIILDQQGIVKVDLPRDAQNIKVNKIISETSPLPSNSEENKGAVEEVGPSQGSSPSSPDNSAIEELGNNTAPPQERRVSEAKATITGGITGAVIGEQESGNFLTRILNFIRGLFTPTITGNVVRGVQTADAIEVTIDDIATKYEIEYETTAPQSFEEQLGRGKKITISGPHELNYTNILAFTDISGLPANKIRLYKTTDGVRESTQFATLDSNSDGSLDRIEWIVPHLSNQTYELIIEITKAEHLDSNRDFVSDIYKEVRYLDNLWSEEIPDQDYVRATFETPLDSSRDITLYPRITGGTPRIEVYEEGSTEKIAEFTSLNSEEYNTIYLTELQGSQAVFDLRIVGGSIELNHIIDPLDSVYQLAQIYQTGVNDNAQTEQTIRFDQETLVHSNFSHPDNSNLSFNENGIYKISYGCLFRETGIGNNRLVVESWLELDNAYVNTSETHCYIRQTADDGDRCQNSMTTIVNVTQGSNITMHSLKVSTGTGTDPTSEESCWLYAKKVINPVAQIYKVTNEDLQLTATPVSLDFEATTYVDEGNFTVDIARNWISVDQAGWYKIYSTATYMQLAGSTDNVRHNPSTQVFLDNSSKYVPSQSYAYTKRVLQVNWSTTSSVTLINLNVSQNISLQGYEPVGDATNKPFTREETSLLMERIPSDDILFLYDSAGGQATAGTDNFDVNITWNQEILDGDNYTHAANSEFFTIDSNGWYEVSYQVGWDDGGTGNRFIGCGQLRRNNVVVEPSRQCDYSRGNAEARYGSVASTFVVNNTAGDEYTVQWTGADVANSLVAEGSWIIVTQAQIYVDPEVASDLTYPTFTSHTESPTNGTSIYAPGATYIMNVSILNSNGSFGSGIEFDGINYTTASNTSIVEFNVSILDLSVGNFSYYWWAYGNGTDQNFNASRILRGYTVNLSTSEVNLSFYANGTKTNITIDKDSSLLINGTIITGDNQTNLTLYKNNSIMNIRPETVDNTTTFSDGGVENITLVYTASQNFTSSRKSYLVNVSASPSFPITTFNFGRSKIMGMCCNCISSSNFLSRIFFRKRIK